jgi:hypothetical protein
MVGIAPSADTTGKKAEDLAGVETALAYGAYHE